MSKARQFNSLEEVRRCVPVVAAALRGIPTATIPNEAAIAICALATCNEALIERVTNLESIAPKKITANGKTYVWHCPNELIPERPF